jgi:hypothetical protein
MHIAKNILVYVVSTLMLATAQAAVHEGVGVTYCWEKYANLADMYFCGPRMLILLSNL